MLIKRSTSTSALTLVEVLVVVAVIVVITAIWSVSRPRPSASRATCINNLKQIGIGFRLYSMDGDPYPEFSTTNKAWNYFQTVGSEIGSPRVLLCSEDRSRQKYVSQDFDMPPKNTSFADPSHRNRSLSYFYGADCGTNQIPELIVAGDRSISTNDTLLVETTLFNTNSGIRWTKNLHDTRGNVALADGSVQQFTTEGLRSQILLASNSVQRFVLP